jgi:hypothetical protein
MNWYTMFYLFSILEKLQFAFAWGAGLMTAGFVVLTIAHLINKETVNSDNYGSSTAAKWIATLKWPRISCLVLCIMFWLLLVFIPNRKDMILIIAGGAVGEFVTNDENAKELPADITRFLRGEILKATAELSDEAKASIGIKSEVENVAEKIKDMSRQDLEKLLLEKMDKK